MRMLTGGLFALALALAGQPAPVMAAAGSCPDVAKLSVPNTTITMAQPVEGGRLHGAGRRAAPATSPRCPRSAASRRRSSRRATPTSRLKSGCRRPAGTASSRRSGTARSTARSPTRRWRRALARGYADGVDRHRPHRRQRELRARPSGESDRLRLARRPRDDGRVEERSSPRTTAAAPKFSYWNGCSAGGRQAMKAERRGSRPTSTASSPARPGSTGPDAPRRPSGSSRRSTDNPAARLLQPSASCSTAPRRGVRRARRRQGRRASRTRRAASSIRRSRSARAGERGVPDDGAGRDRTADLFAREESEERARDRRPRCRQRARMDRHRMDGIRARQRTRSVPLHRLRQSELDDSAVQVRHRHRARRRSRQQHHQRARPEPEAVHRSRRQADSVPRLERSADFPGEQHAVLSRVRSRRAAARRR